MLASHGLKSPCMVMFRGWLGVAVEGCLGEMQKWVKMGCRGQQGCSPSEPSTGRDGEGLAEAPLCSRSLEGIPPEGCRGQGRARTLPLNFMGFCSPPGSLWKAVPAAPWFLQLPFLQAAEVPLDGSTATSFVSSARAACAPPLTRMLPTPGMSHRIVLGSAEQPFTSQPLVFKVLQAELKCSKQRNPAVISDCLGDRVLLWGCLQSLLSTGNAGTAAEHCAE